jgi:uncharacterized alkaline shock family protein YloU
MNTIQDFWNLFLTSLTVVIEHIKTNPEIFVGGLGLIFLLYIYCKLCRGSKIICIFNSDGGKVYVAKSALKELITNACDHLNEDYKASGEVQQRGRKLAIKVNLELEAGESLSVIAKEVQDYLTKVLSETIGIEYIETIDIVVKGFRSSRKALMDKIR